MSERTTASLLFQMGVAELQRRVDCELEQDVHKAYELIRDAAPDKARHVATSPTGQEILRQYVEAGRVEETYTMGTLSGTLRESLGQLVKGLIDEQAFAAAEQAIQYCMDKGISKLSIPK